MILCCQTICSSLHAQGLLVSACSYTLERARLREKRDLPGAVRACGQNLLHLLITCEHHLSSDKPADYFAQKSALAQGDLGGVARSRTVQRGRQPLGGRLTSFVTGRARQATLVRPEFVEPGHTRQRFWQGQRGLHLRCVVEPNKRRGKLVDERIVGVARIQHDCKHRLLVTLSINVHKMKLSAGAIVVDRVISWGVDMPAGQVNSLVIVGQRGEISIDSLSVLYRESRTITPVPEVSDRLVGIIESGNVVLR